MSEYLFSYGTLQLPGVQERQFGRIVPMMQDRLPGFRVDTVVITDLQVLEASGLAEHPILRRTADEHDTVHGVVLELTSTELAAADSYEVDDYVRIAVTLQSGTPAWVYVSAADAEAATEATKGSGQG